MINHIVLLQLKLGVDKKRVKEMYKYVYGLKDKISGIKTITGGVNNSPEKELTRNYTEGFIVTFKDSQKRDAYLIHPTHKYVADTYIIPIIDAVLVYDYEFRI